MQRAGSSLSTPEKGPWGRALASSSARLSGPRPKCAHLEVGKTQLYPRVSACACVPAPRRSQSHPLESQAVVCP